MNRKMNREKVIEWANERIESLTERISKNEFDKLQTNIAFETIEYLEYITTHLN